MKKFLLSVGVCLAIFETLSAQQNEVFVKDGAAISGYDAIAYFKENRPVKGNSEFSVQYKGATWLFVNKANADLLLQLPKNMSRNMVVIALLVVQEVTKQKQAPMHGRSLTANYI